MQILFDFTSVIYSFPICAFPPVLKILRLSPSTEMVPLLSSKYFDYDFFQNKNTHTTHDYILSGGHLMSWSGLNAVGARL